MTGLGFPAKRGSAPAASRLDGAVMRWVLMPVLALSMAGCHPHARAAADEPALKIASQKGGAKSLMLAAHAVDGAPCTLELSSAQALLEALSADAVDAGAVGDAPFMLAYATGAMIKAVQASNSGAVDA